MRETHQGKIYCEVIGKKLGFIQPYMPNSVAYAQLNCIVYEKNLQICISLCLFQLKASKSLRLSTRLKCPWTHIILNHGFVGKIVWQFYVVLLVKRSFYTVSYASMFAYEFPALRYPNCTFTRTYKIYKMINNSFCFTLPFINKQQKHSTKKCFCFQF